MTRLSLVAASLLVATSLSACEADGGHDKAADPGTCLAKATPVALPASFPAFPFPHGTVVFNVEDRGADGIIASGITKSPLKQVLADLNGPAQKAGYKVTHGETEAHDAEANWTGHGFIGRWAIKDSVACPGEVSIQVLARKA